MIALAWILLLPPPKPITPIAPTAIPVAQTAAPGAQRLPARGSASTRVELTDEVYQIPAKEWWWVEVNLRQKPAEVSASFAVQSGPHKVRIALMTRDDLERLSADMPHGVLAVSDPAPSGNLTYRVRHRGNYVLLVDNRDGNQPAAVHLRIALDFAPAPPALTGISPQRQLTVILMSFAFFAGVVTYSARRLWLARQR